MRFRDWLREGLTPPASTDESAAAADSQQLQRLQQVSRELLTAGAQAIERALSSDSEAFLRSTRQESGQ